MKKEKFLELQSLAWDYNRRHPNKRVQLTEQLDLEHPSLSTFFFVSYDNMECTDLCYDPAEIEKILRS